MTISAEQREYTGQEFKGLTLPGTRLDSIEFESCTFVRCSFREGQFETCKFRDCTFRKCDLTFAHVDGCVFAGTVFEDCQLVGINWTEAAWTKSMLRQPVSFSGCALNHSIFTGLKLHGLRLTKCLARNVDFSECDLTRADLRRNGSVRKQVLAHQPDRGRFHRRDRLRHLGNPQHAQEDEILAPRGHLAAT